MKPLTTGPELAAAALSLLGIGFHLHGRDPRSGLDCVGVLEAALARCGVMLRLPNSYPLRARKIDDPTALFASVGLLGTHGAVDVGDVLLLRPHPCQYHLAIATGVGRIVHAHASLRRVVHSPLPADWPIAGHWRFPSPRS